MNQKFLTTNQRRHTHVRGNVLLGEWGQDFIDRRLANVHQHAGARESPCCLNLVPPRLRDGTAQRLPTIVPLQHLPIRHRRHPFVVEFEPACMPIWFDESEIMSTVEIAGVYEDTMKLVLPGFGPVSSVIEEAIKIDLKGEFEAIVDLRGESEPNQ